MDASPFLTIWNDKGPPGETPPPGGIAFKGADGSPVGTVSPRTATTGHLASASSDPNDLRAQRWGLVIPEGDEGQRLLGLVEELVKHRAGQQGIPPEKVLSYPVKPGMSYLDAEKFIDGEYWDKVDRQADRLPQYLLILGDADQVSWALQQTLGRHGIFTGRLAFTNADKDVENKAYRAYASKVIAWESKAPSERDVLFYLVNDPSAALVSARTGFVLPAQDAVSRAAAQRSPNDLAVKVDSVGLKPVAPPEQELEMVLARARTAEGAVLVSVSHGAGVREGDGEEQRRAHQGGLLVSEKCALFADRVESGPFLPGGAWFFFACFSAGVPVDSAYAGWLQSLADDARAADALSTLSKVPFVAALPKAALANPAGPLAVVGHVDLAWSWSYDAVHDGKEDQPVPRAERLSELLRGWLQGNRFGPSHHALSRGAADVGSTLMARYDMQASGKITAEDAWNRQTSYCWLEYQDLNAYVLLGDPAAALPGPQRPPAQQDLQAAAIAAPPPAALPKALKDAEDVVLDVLSSHDPDAEMAKVAKRHATDADEIRRRVDEIRRRVEVYRSAGRKALSEYLSAATPAAPGNPKGQP